MNVSLIFATHNQHKSQEVAQMLPDYELLNLDDIGFYDEIVENGQTFHENAEIKVDTIHKTHQGNIFADDSGLVIPALGGEPGIYSARYAGTGESEDNIQKVLQKLEGTTQRSAYFIAVICLIFEGKKYFFEGRVHGVILHEKHGKKGFGYDPIFQPDSYEKSFAEICAEEKNRVSHRGRAIAAMNAFLRSQASSLI